MGKAKTKGVISKKASHLCPLLNLTGICKPKGNRTDSINASNEWGMVKPVPMPQYPLTESSSFTKASGLKNSRSVFAFTSNIPKLKNAVVEKSKPTLL